MEGHLAVSGVAKGVGGITPPILTSLLKGKKLDSLLCRKSVLNNKGFNLTVSNYVIFGKVMSVAKISGMRSFLAILLSLSTLTLTLLCRHFKSCLNY